FLIDNVEVKKFQNLQSNFVDFVDKILNDMNFFEYFSYEIAVDKNLINRDYNNNEYLKYMGILEIKLKDLEDLSNQIDLQVVNVQNSILQT
ncbi:TPA: hypothetical protein ACGDLC_002832, partial [Acinetobacter baumannii]